MTPRPYVIELGARNKLADYFRVSAGKGGGQMVTVRVGERSTVCLTCLNTTCAHVRAVEDHLADARRAGSEAA